LVALRRRDWWSWHPGRRGGSRHGLWGVGSSLVLCLRWGCTQGCRSCWCRARVRQRQSVKPTEPFRCANEGGWSRAPVLAAVGVLRETAGKPLRCPEPVCGRRAASLCLKLHCLGGACQGIQHLLRVGKEKHKRGGLSPWK